MHHYPKLLCEQKLIHYRLRTLMIFLALGPPLLAIGFRTAWLVWETMFAPQPPACLF